MSNASRHLRRFAVYGAILASLALAAPAWTALAAEPYDPSGAVPNDPSVTAPNNPGAAAPDDPIDMAPNNPGAAAPDDEIAAEVDDPIAASKSCLKEGDYDQAVRNLKGVIARADQDPRLLGMAYLLLVKTYVMHGNFYKTEPQGRETTELFYREGRRYAEECLRTPALRHIRPEPISDYPPEMIDLFQKVRYETLGSLRILKVTPADATVILDGDTLHVAPPDTLLAETDLAAGPHRLVLHRDGYKDLNEAIQISAGAATERVYSLRRRHGALWYASRSGVVVGGGVAAILAFHKETRPGPPLDGPAGYPR